VHLSELSLGKCAELSRDGRDLLRLSFGACTALDVLAFECAGFRFPEKSGHVILLYKTF